MNQTPLSGVNKSSYLIHLIYLSRLIYSISMLITISGLPGSGKSTIGKMLAKKLGYKFYSVGDLRGKMALERGLTIEELNKLGESEQWTDKEADDYQVALAKRENNFVIDGRISFHFMPQSFKIFLSVDPNVAAKRVFPHPRPDEKRPASIEELKTAMAARMQSDGLRYKKYYNIVYPDPSAFNLVIDTSNLTPDAIVDQILTALKK